MERANSAMLVLAMIAGGAKPVYHRSIGCSRRSIDEHLGARPRRLAGDIEQVLEGLGKALVESACAIVQMAGRGDPEWGWKTSAATLFGPPSIALAQ